MTTILLILLITVELGFMIFGLISGMSKKEWTLKRGIANLCQLLIYILLLIFPGIDTGFRFKGLMICLGSRLIVSVFFIFLNRKNGKIKKKAALVSGALLSIVLIAFSMIPAFLFADYQGRPCTGPYKVLETDTVLVDLSRTESFENDGSFREIPVYFFYPETEGKFPLVIFSHGAFGYYQSNMSTYTELASHGYVVASIEHPYHSLFTRDTAGSLITADPDFLRNALNIGSSDDGYTEEEIFSYTSVWMELRTEDMNFVIDTLKKASENGVAGAFFETDGSIDQAVSMIDGTRIGLMGHSLGGATAVTCGRRDDISAVIDLDGTMLGEIESASGNESIINTEPYTTPLLNMESESHHMDRIGAEEMNITYVNSVILSNADVAFNTYFAGSEHMDFTDLPLFSPALAGNLGSGDIDHARMIDTVNGIVVRFFDCYLKGEGTFSVNECY